MDTPPQRPRPGTTGILLILVLLVLGAGLAFWGWSETPPASPQPGTTSFPDRVPNAAPAEQ